MAQRWTQEDKEDFVKEVKSNPLEIDWDKYVEKYGRSEARLRSIYGEYVTPLEHVMLCVTELSLSKIQDMAKELENRCTNCNVCLYSDPKIWKQNKYCEECYIRLFKLEVDKMWKQVEEYAIIIGKTSCVICDKHVKYDATVGHRFNFDHINMFEKTSSIGNLVFTGESMDDIKKEMDLCQVVCISCHELITHLERKIGFTRLKQVYTRNSIEIDGARIYKSIMSPIYHHLRMIHQHQKGAICKDVVLKESDP